MSLFLLSYKLYGDSFNIKHYKLIHADTMQQAEDKLDAYLFIDYHDVINETIL